MDFVKRLVGLPGDRTQMIKGVLQINGQPVKHERIDDFVGDDGVRIKSYREMLPDGLVYTTLDLTENGFNDNTPVLPSRLATISCWVTISTIRQTAGCCRRSATCRLKI